MHLFQFGVQTFGGGEILKTTLFGNRVCSLIDVSSFEWLFCNLWLELWSRNNIFVFLYLLTFCVRDLLLVLSNMTKTKMRSVCAPKSMPFFTDNDSDSDTVDTLALLNSQKVLIKRKGMQMVSAERADALINWIREIPCLYQKGLREDRGTQKGSWLWANKGAEVEMTSEFFVCNFTNLKKHF